MADSALAVDETLISTRPGIDLEAAAPLILGNQSNVDVFGAAIRNQWPQPRTFSRFTPDETRLRLRTAAARAISRYATPGSTIGRDLMVAKKELFSCEGRGESLLVQVRSVFMQEGMKSTSYWVIRFFRELRWVCPTRTVPSKKDTWEG